MDEGVFIVEPAGRYMKLLFKVNKIHYFEKSPYQEVLIADIEGFGRSLLLDKFIQSTEKDEYIYHELLVHPAMITHPEPEKVLILGGGEGASLREVLKHETVREAVMVDIDPVVVELSKKHLEYIHQGSFRDERSRVIIMDGREYIRQAPRRYFDVVIMDLTDPYASEIARPLYGREALREIKDIMEIDGVFVTQAGSSYFYPDEYRFVLDSIRANFNHVSEYWFWIPSFGLNVNYILASDVYNLGEAVHSADRRLTERGVKTRLVNARFLEGLLKIGVLYPS